jgi:diaminobutyrate-2-oxoglutarate transaminase
MQFEVAEEVYDRFESCVRSYCRSYPIEFHRAIGSYLVTEKGDCYFDAEY